MMETMKIMLMKCCNDNVDNNDDGIRLLVCVLLIIVLLLMIMWMLIGVIMMRIVMQFLICGIADNEDVNDADNNAC